MALGDFLSLPHIVRFETDNYTGQPGSTVRVIAEDKCKVKYLRLRIARADGVMIEEGDAVQVAGTRAWEYATTAANPDLSGTVITAVATDLPGYSVTGTATL